jgi:threonine/homoserine/homoserine lactone efflux protein
VSVEFFVTSLIVVVSPGTGVLYTLAAGLSRGRRASVVAAVGCTLGIVPHIAAAVLGVTALVHTSALAFELLKFAGVGYLLYLAASAVTDRGALAVNVEAGPRSSLRVIVSAILVNILNPKLSVFFFAFLPQFVDPGDEHALARMLEMSAVFMLMTLVVFVAYGLAAAAVRAHLVARPRVVVWMRRAFAAAFVALGLRLVTSDR